MFEQSVIEQIGYYVYFLRDPNNNEVFYIGKGKDNRVFDHVLCSLNDEEDSYKMERIRNIQETGKSVEHFILRHGLSEASAFEVEAAIIDFIGISNLSNIQSGHHSNDFGIKTTNEVSVMYSAEPLDTKENILLININRLFDRTMTASEIYEATRKSWRVSVRRNLAEFAVATYGGLTREVYKINNWYEVEDGRWAFNGDLADSEIQRRLRYKSIKNYSTKGAANPVRYINCYLTNSA